MRYLESPKFLCTLKRALDVRIAELRDALDARDLDAVASRTDTLRRQIRRTKARINRIDGPVIATPNDLMRLGLWPPPPTEESTHA